MSTSQADFYRRGLIMQRTHGKVGITQRYKFFTFTSQKMGVGYTDVQYRSKRDRAIASQVFVRCRYKEHAQSIIACLLLGIDVNTVIKWHPDEVHPHASWAEYIGDK